jgi:hypothetical protein
MARGTHQRQGPLRDPNALRRDREKGPDGFITLPVCRDGDAPVWPLPEPTPRELGLWVTEWERPQAVMWEVHGLELEVAVYVRTLVSAESPKATAAERTLLMRQQENLGLSMPGLARNKWRITGVGPPAPAPRSPRSAQGSSARDRLKVVHDGEPSGSA